MSLPNDRTTADLVAALGAGSLAVSASSTEGRRLLRTRERGMLHLIARELAKAARRGYRGRRANDVVAHYEPDYAGDAAAIAASYGQVERPILFRLVDCVARLEGRFPLALMTRLVGDVVAGLGPSTVCEVGCGHGRALLHIAARLPDVACSGFELTRAGVAAADGLKSLELWDTAYGRLYGLKAEDMQAVRNTKFTTASAFSLPAPDNSFDVVYTFAALEQMADGLPRALAEIRRVSRRHVVLFEPFADANDLLARGYLWSRNYFRMHVAELERHGLRPVRLWRNVPVKPTFAYAILLCERM